MTRKSPETFAAILEAVANNLGPLKHCLALSGVSETTLFRWRIESKAKPQDWLCDFEGETMPFHIALKRAQLAGVAAMRAHAFDIATNGERVPIFFNGAPVWEIDPLVASDAKALDEFSWDCKYGSRPRADVYKRDQNGALVQAQQRLATNANILVAALRATDPQFVDRSEQVVSHRGGVLMVGAQQPQLAPPTQTPPVHQLEAQPTQDAEFREVPRDPSPAPAMTAPEPEAIEPSAPPSPENFGAVADPRMAIKPGDTALVRELKQKYWDKLARNVEEAKSPTPPSAPPPLPPEMRPSPDDDLDDVEGKRIAPKPLAPEAIDNRVGEILAKRTRGGALTAIERQICAAHDRGSHDYIRQLLGPSPSARAERVGEPSPPKGGYKIAG